MLPSLKRTLLTMLALARCASPSFGDAPQGDLGAYYRAPLSIGAAYRSLTPFAGYRTGFDVYELSASARYTTRALPWLQPVITGGLFQFVPRDTGSRWGHQDAYGLLGAAFTWRMSKALELGAELSGGASLSLYPDLLPDTGTLYASSLLARAEARLALIPSFNVAVELAPSLTYQRSLGPLSDFDGLSLGIGLSAQVRFGEDPDSPKAALRSLRITAPRGLSAFPAMQSWYVRNPLATVTVENTGTFTVRDVAVAFFQKGYMDAPTACAAIPEMKPGERRDVGILASFNEEVFTNEGVRPLVGDVSVTYTGQGRPGEQHASLSYDLQDKTGIVWDDNRKAAAFITPADGALRNYASWIRQIHKETLQPGYSETVQFACQVFNALAELGILYQADPLQPFASVMGAAATLDSVSLPRQTMTRATGDCDDLTVLYASILESAGVPTALVTVPGHIYAAFDAKTAGRDFADLAPDRDMTIAVAGGLWIPVEITLIGRARFTDAWRKGVEEWRAAEADPSQRGFYVTSAAQELYRPIGLRESDLGLQYGRKEAVVASTSREVGALVDAIVDAAAAAAMASGSKLDKNRLGIRLARFGRYDKAIAAFREAGAMDPGYAAPRLNLGNAYLLSKSYDKALAEYQRLDAALSPGGATHTLAVLRLNMAQCCAAMGRQADASRYLGMATAIEPDIGKDFPSVERGSGTAARAAESAAPAVNPLFEE
jgi:hypothetical protein